MIDLANERPLYTLRQVAKFFPPARNGKERHISFFIRGITDGVNGVKLEAIRDGSRWLTSREALQRWMEAQTAAVLGESSPADRPSRRHAAERADAKLVAAGY